MTMAHKNKSVARKKTARKTKSVRASSPIQLADIWPSERDFMARPDRYKYVRKIVQPKGCVFCAAARKGVGLKPLVLYKGPHAMVMLNKYPYNNGHLLVLPVRHCGQLQGLSAQEYDALSQILLKAFNAVQESLQCAGVNIGLNHGAAAGAGIPEHLHWHIVPRWHGDTNFFPIVAETKVLAETLEQTFARLLPFFDGIKDA